MRRRHFLGDESLQLLPAIVVVLAFACNEAAPLPPLGAAGDGSSVAAATYTRVWDEVLLPKNCRNMYCHGTGAGALDLSTKEKAYSTLVGVSARGMDCIRSGKLRVEPFEPERSLLLEKLSNPKPSCGDAMPVGTWFEPSCPSANPSVCNTMADLDLVRAWIAAGAHDD
jgi:hypothetical protein